MLWWNRSRRYVDRSSRAATRRLAQRGRFHIEALETRMPLGSVPTATGTLAGELLPIETVDLLSPQAERGASADMQLADAQRPRQAKVDAAFDELVRLQADARAAVRGSDETPDESSPTASERGTEASESDEQHAPTQSDLQESGNNVDAAADQELRALDTSELNEAEEETLAEESSNIEKREDDESEEEETESTEESSSSADGLPEHSEGSVESTQAVDLTFAATGQPADAARAVAGPAPAFTGGNQNGTDTAMQAILAALNSSNRSGNGLEFRPVAPGIAEPQGNAWFEQTTQPVVVRYDFRDQGDFVNQITPAEQVAAETALDAWTQATNNRVQFVRDYEAPAHQIINIGKGDLAAFGHVSDIGRTLAVGGGKSELTGDGSTRVSGIVWLDQQDTWDTTIGNGDAIGTYDVFTAVAHEVGHSLGGEDDYNYTGRDIMYGVYDQARSVDSIRYAVEHHEFTALTAQEAADDGSYEIHALITGFPQLTAAEVDALLGFSTAVTNSNDAIIAIVDRRGRILGVRVEDGVIAALDSPANPRTMGNGNGVIDPLSEEERTLVFAIDGAVAKARTAAFFANDGGPAGTPLTSRTIRNISQTTISYREVHSNPNSGDPNYRGPGVVAPIGVGGHFPPEVLHTPPVDLFAIEYTNRDSIVHAGPDGDRSATLDNMILPSRFNVPLAFIPIDTNGDGIPDLDDNGNGVVDGSAIPPPESYGRVSGRLPTAQARGIGTLPGGVPLFRDTPDANGMVDGIGDTLVGGVGVFFPGPEGTADFEQGFIAGIGQLETARNNAPKVLEAELIAVATAGGSLQAERAGAEGAKSLVVNLGHPVPSLDIPFGNITLVGIQLEVIGPTPGLRGVRQLLDFGRPLLPPDIPTAVLWVNGANQMASVGGTSVPDGWLVAPHGSDTDGDGVDEITAADVIQIVEQGVAEANLVRAAIRLSFPEYSERTRMVFSVADRDGNVLGIFRMPDSTIFSVDVAVAKARNTAYYADPVDIREVDQVETVFGDPATTLPDGTAFTNRTFRFLVEPRYPSGVEGSRPGKFSILHDLARATGVINVGSSAVQLVEASAPGAALPGPISAAIFDDVGPLGTVGVAGDNANGLPGDSATAGGHDVFFPGTNFRDIDDPYNQNGIVFFPGSMPIYKNGVLVGGFGVSGDGVDQDDVVTFSGAVGFFPPDPILQADEVFVDGVRLPYTKFLRNPRG